MHIRHVISVSGGKDSTATLLLALKRVPREQIVPIFCDTGNEIPVTHAYLDDLESHLGIRIHRLKADFSAEIAAKRRFIARDQRTKREYQRVTVRDAQGRIVPARDSQGLIRYRTALKKGVEIQEVVPKTRKAHGKKVRWSNKAKRRALAVLHPTGNPFLDLCLWKGRFPSRMAQFCTEELKRNIAVTFQLDLIDQGFSVVSWQGIRRDESQNRRNAKHLERIGPKLWAFRPLVDWTAQQTVDFVRSQDCLPLESSLFSGAEPRWLCLHQQQQGWAGANCLPPTGGNRAIGSVGNASRTSIETWLFHLYVRRRRPQRSSGHFCRPQHPRPCGVGQGR